jgi:hypothetical protein
VLFFICEEKKVPPFYYIFSCLSSAHWSCLARAPRSMFFPALGQSCFPLSLFTFSSKPSHTPPAFRDFTFSFHTVRPPSCLFPDLPKLTEVSFLLPHGSAHLGSEIGSAWSWNPEQIFLLVEMSCYPVSYSVVYCLISVVCLDYGIK